MDINTTAKAIADIIADEVTEATSLRCETFASDYGYALIVANYIHLVARIVPDYKSYQVVAAPCDPEEGTVISIPTEATSLSGVRELATQLDDAIAHVTAAAVAAVGQ